MSCNGLPSLSLPSPIYRCGWPLPPWCPKPLIPSRSLWLWRAFLRCCLGPCWRREVRGKVLALRQSDFILAAREMGASDARIIFRHLYPNTLSHVIVVLTLTIPGVILAESFLSFLGIGITEPLISWGLMMRNTQDIQTLGQNSWILAPIAFIVVAVLGFNFLGDGLRDAADPYAAM